VLERREEELFTMAATAELFITLLRRPSAKPGHVGGFWPKNRSGDQAWLSATRVLCTVASSGGVSITMLGWLGRVGVLRIGMLMSTQKMFVMREIHQLLT
jgi:hypothetical protein